MVKNAVPDLFVFGDNKIDFNGLIAYNKKTQITLTKREAMLLKLLVENKNEVVTREKILQAVWGYNVYPTTRTIDNFIWQNSFALKKSQGAALDTLRNLTPPFFVSHPQFVVHFLSSPSYQIYCGAPA